MISITKPMISSLTTVACASLAWAGPLDIRRNDGVQVVFSQDIRSDFNEPGDRFTARVEKDPLLPHNTLLTGRILRVHPANRYRAASMDMVFTEMTLPSGDTYTINAVPTPPNDPHLSRGADGRIVAAYKPGEDSAYAFGGTIGGLILGGIGHRPILGAFFGSLIGGLAGAMDRHANANLVVRKGEKFVAVFNEDVAFTAKRGRSGWRRPERDLPDRAGVPVAPLSGIPEIRVNGTQIRFPDAAPYRANGVAMVPLAYTADQLNLIATVHEDGTVTLDGPDSGLQLHVGSDSCVSSSGRSTLSYRVEDHNGTIYAPVDVFTRLTTEPITVDGQPISR